MKKILLPILTLVLVCMASCPVFSGGTTQTYIATADFYDFDPELIHDNPRVEEVISCNMVLKPRTQAHLSRLCDSAVGNVRYYFNDSTSDVQKGPDYTGIVTDEIFYPATRVISNSYIGGKINYKASCDFQTRKTSGEKIYMEVPTDAYQPAVIISSKTKYLDMGEEYTLYQDTGDQSQPKWVGTKKAYPSLAGNYMNWTFRFGTLENNVSGVFGLFKARMKNVTVLNCVNAINLNTDTQDSWDDGGFGTDEIFYLDSSQPNQSLNAEDLAVCRKAKKFFMEYNMDPRACDDKGHVLKEDGWVRIAEEQDQYLKFENDTLYYPEFFNAWGRIIAVLEVPTADDCKPVRRTIVKGRIGVKYPGFEFKNMKEGDVLKIYNVNGKKIREITSGTAEGFVWDGRNDSGDWAKSGIYIYQIKVDGKLVSGTIAFVY